MRLVPFAGLLAVLADAVKELHDALPGLNGLRSELDDL